MWDGESARIAGEKNKKTPPAPWGAVGVFQTPVFQTAQTENPLVRDDTGLCRLMSVYHTSARLSTTGEAEDGEVRFTSPL